MIQVHSKWARPSAYACCGKEQPNNVANLPKYAVHGGGATKPPAPESPRTASLKPINACFLSCHYTLLLMSGGDLRPPSPVICIRTMSCSKARSSQITPAITRPTLVVARNSQTI